MGAFPEKLCAGFSPISRGLGHGLAFVHEGAGSFIMALVNGVIARGSASQPPRGAFDQLWRRTRRFTRGIDRHRCRPVVSPTTSVIVEQLHFLVNKIRNWLGRVKNGSEISAVWAIFLK